MIYMISENKKVKYFARGAGGGDRFELACEMGFWRTRFDGGLSPLATTGGAMRNFFAQVICPSGKFVVQKGNMLNTGNLMSKRMMKPTTGNAKTRGQAGGSTVTRDDRTGELRAPEGRVEAIMAAAERSGLLADMGSSRIAGRVSPTLVEEAKRRTGIKADTDLIAFALANVALEDNFAKAFEQAHGKVDADLKLGY